MDGGVIGYLSIVALIMGGTTAMLLVGYLFFLLFGWMWEE
jgi:hypothetical protein